MPSFDAVNYSIRPNKAVERKTIFSGLMKLSHLVDLGGHIYVGLGSLWFVDFLMAHKLLGINSMKSIESTEIGLSRSRFNCPLSCIEVVPGDSTEVIPTLHLEDRPSLVWFDYDSGIGGPAIRDIAMIASRCAPNTVLIVTVSAKRDDLPTKDENDVEINPETSLRLVAGDLVPTPLAARRLQRNNYPKLLCEILLNQLQSATVNSGRPESFVKLFDIVYSDATPMATVGGIIPAAGNVDAIRQLAASPGWEGILPDPISIPPLTIKEKIALDRMMPSANPPTDAQMRAIGFQLKREQIDMYHRHYLHYPMFGEFFW
jgi:hypothetical protein